MDRIAACTPEERRALLLGALRLGGLTAALGGGAFWLRRRSERPAQPATRTAQLDRRVPPDSNLPALVVATGDEPARLVSEAIRALGGIDRFVRRGDVVLLKPNVAWDRTADQAATTNPAVLAAVASLCRDAGASQVLVADVTIHEPHRCFQRSGIAAAARSAGARLLTARDSGFARVNLQGDVLGEWPVLRCALEADRIINLPIAKHHSLTGVSLGIKNWMGLLGGERQRLHQRIHESLADLASFVRPTLTLIDAYRVLLRNGPTGGSSADVVVKKNLIAGTDPVALDAFAAKAYWDLDWKDLRYLRLAGDRGLGTVQFENLSIRIVVV